MKLAQPDKTFIGSLSELRLPDYLVKHLQGLSAEPEAETTTLGDSTLEAAWPTFSLEQDYSSPDHDPRLDTITGLENDWPRFFFDDPVNRAYAFGEQPEHPVERHTSFSHEQPSHTSSGYIENRLDVLEGPSSKSRALLPAGLEQSHSYDPGSLEVIQYHLGRIEGALSHLGKDQPWPSEPSFAYIRGRLDAIGDNIDMLYGASSRGSEEDILDYVPFEANDRSGRSQKPSKGPGLDTICLTPQSHVNLADLQRGEGVLALGRRGLVGFEVGGGNGFDRDVYVHGDSDDEYMAHLGGLLMEDEVSEESPDVETVQSFSRGKLEKGHRYHVEGLPSDTVQGLYVWQLN